MLRSLLLIPLRVGVRVTELGLRGTAEVLERIAVLAGAGSQAPEPPPPAEPVPGAWAEPEPEAEADLEPVIGLRDRGEPVDYDAPEPVVPAHVDEGVELVEELADPGAQDGAGAEVHVAEPWNGYRDLRAAEIIDRLGGASAAELAAIELYELAGRRRQTVIAAAQRELSRRR